MTRADRGGDLLRRLRKGYLRTLNSTLNRATRRLALAGRGPFSVVVHTGRKSGREYRTPLLLASVPEGFVAELTYGPNVDWLRNVEAAGGCTLIHGGVTLRVTGVEPCDAERGRAAFPVPARLVLTVFRKKHYRVLRIAAPPTGRGDQA
jgi:deazaflavin-dependent oxidoreductase (nitroreductase family)